MGLVINCICDGCGTDLSETGNCEAYLLALVVQNIPNNGPKSTSMAVEPPIKKDAYFCGLGCLLKWAKITEGN